MHALKLNNFLKLKNSLEGILPFLSDFKLKQNNIWKAVGKNYSYISRDRPWPHGRRIGK